MEERMYVASLMFLSFTAFIFIAGLVGDLSCYIYRCLKKAIASFNERYEKYYTTTEGFKVKLFMQFMKSYMGYRFVYIPKKATRRVLRRVIRGICRR